MAELSRDAVIKRLGKFYDGKESDFISTEMLLSTANRVDNPKNRAWLYATLYLMKSFNLFTKQYTARDGRHRLNGIHLTEQGRQAIGSQRRAGGLGGGIARNPTMASLLMDVETLREKFPQFEVVFKIALKEEQSPIGSVK